MTCKQMIRTCPTILILAALLALSGVAEAATPPDRVHYQGVLRDASGNPLNGSNDLVFRFFTLASGGSEILVDRHTSAAGYPVIVDDGLFNVELGGGLVEDGSSGGTYTSLPAVFRAIAAVWIEVEVNGEAMLPRSQIFSSPYAMNADQLDGIDGAGFLRSDASDTFNGGVLSIGSGSILAVDGSLRLNGTLEMKDGGGDADQRINFFDSGVAANEYILWDDSEDRFQISDDLHVLNTLRTGSYLSVEGNLFLNENGGEADRSLYFYNNGSATGEYIRWDDSAGLFLLSDDVDVQGNLLLDNQLRMNADGPDGAVSLFFYNDGSDTGEYIGWNDADSRFNVSANTNVEGTLDADEDIYVGEVGYDPSIYFWNSDAEVWESIRFNSTNGEFSMSDQLYVNGSVSIGPAEDNTLPNYNHFGSGVSSPDEPGISTSNDVYIEGDLEVDGTLFPYKVKGVGGSHLSMEADINARTMIDADNSTTGNLATWHHDGDYGSFRLLAELQEDGDLRLRGVVSQNVAFDLAESFIAGEPLEPGELVRLDPDLPGGVRRSTGAGDGLVIGIVSAQPGFLLGSAPFDVKALRRTWGDAVADRFDAELPALRELALAADPDLRGALEALVEADPPAKRQELESQLVSRCLERFHETAFVPVALAGRVPVRVDTRYGAIRAGDPLAPSPLPGVAMRHDGSGPVVGTALEPSAEGKPTVLAFVHRGGTAVATNPDPAEETRASVDHDGDHDGGSAAALADGLFHVDENGDVLTPGAFRADATEVAELFPVSEPVEPGDVLVLDRNEPGSCRRGDEAEDPAVIGVVSGDPGVMLGSDVERDGHAPVGLSGVLACKVDAGYGAILPGDLLVSSPTPGHAMRIDAPLPGTVLGKALEPLDQGTGRVRILILHQ